MDHAALLNHYAETALRMKYKHTLAKPLTLGTLREEGVHHYRDQ